MLVLEPIFEADLPPEQYAYRPGHNAQQAVVKVEELMFRGHPEVVDWIELTDGDVISVRISERKLRSSSVPIHMWLFFQKADERARPWQGYFKVVDPEEQ
jgi:hypothetical protein